VKIRQVHLRIALVALGAAVLYNVWYFVLRPAPAPASRVAPQQALIAAPPVQAENPAAVDPVSIPAAPAIDVLAPPSWRRDPFLFGDETRAGRTPVAPPPATSEPVVTSILFSSARRLAMVGGRIVGIGESIDGYTVTDIEHGAVVFTAPSGGRVRVFVHGAPSEGVAR